jgi:two-component system sensor histidine kinase KdpD
MNELTWRNGFFVVAALAAATLAGLGLEHHVGLLSQAMFYVLAVVLTSYTQGTLASVLSALGAVTALNFFFVPPRWTFEVESQEHLISLFTMLLVALAISHLAAKLRHETRAAQCNALRSHQLQELAVALSAAADPQQAAELGRGALCQAFAGPCELALADPTGGMSCDGIATQTVVDGLRACLSEKALLGPGTGRWPGLNAWYVPMIEAGVPLGAAMVVPADSADHDGREHAQALATLVAQALWRLRLSQTMQAAQTQARQQQLQSTLLAAISHDLRTPLAAIVGAASALQSQRDKLGVAEQDRLLQSLSGEAVYLSRVTENTLQWVSLTNAMQPVVLDWESVEEIVGAVLARMHQREASRRIRAHIPAGLPLIKADPVLLSQLLENLLDNALKYSSEGVDLQASADAKALQLTVKDHGPGIAPEQVERIFQPFTRHDHSGQRGVGLGLALCKAIAEVHQGSLTVRRRRAGGSCFTLVMIKQPLFCKFRF